MDWRKKISAEESGSHFRYNADWVRKMNEAVAWIENHLDEDMDFSEAARIARCSVYHFQRFFSWLAEIPLSEYIRRRRLTRAAFDLQNSDAKVIDVALRYGYESPEAFARAFKNIHGITPSEAKVSGARLKAWPCIAFHISIKGEEAMNYRIVHKEAMEMFGVTTEVSTVDNQNFVTVPQFWEICRTDGTMARIREAGVLDETTPLHAAMYNCTDTSHTYMIGYFVPDSGVPEEFTALGIPARMWAVFTSEESGMEEVARQATVMWKRIFTEWFATSGYELANAPELELHHKKGEGQYVAEIWVPIVNKQ